MYYVGIDLGGTNIAVGVCNEQYEIIATASAKTNCPRPCEEICADMVKVTEEAVAKAAAEKMAESRWAICCRGIN